MEREEEQSAAEKAKQETEEREEASQEVRQMEEEGDPPSNLEDWPSGKAKYITYGGPEGDHGYDEGPEAKLGPSELRRQRGRLDHDRRRGGRRPRLRQGRPDPRRAHRPDAPETPMERRRAEMKKND